MDGRAEGIRAVQVMRPERISAAKRRDAKPTPYREPIMLHSKPRKIYLNEKVRLRTCDLRRGMFVCELDRPWLETPFLLQGFEVTSDADIETIMQHCEYVYIDLTRTKVVKPPVSERPLGSFLNKHTSSSRARGIEAAKATHKNTTQLLKTFIDEIRFGGQSPDIQLVKGAVSECVSSVLRNPETMLFLTRLGNKDSSISRHSFNVCIYSIVIGRLLGLDAQKLENLGTCAMLHDMGKVVIPDPILNKPGPLNREEMVIMQNHTVEGRNILMSGRNIFSGVVDVAYGHHENLDGGGYPRGMRGFQLSLNCKIVAVTDKYDAITSLRPYKPEGDHLTAVSILNTLAREGKIDNELTSKFVAYLGIYPPGCIVELSSGELAIVLESNITQRLRPQILVVRALDQSPTQRFVDMSEITTDERGRPYRIVNVRRASDFGIDFEQYYDVIIHALN
jgi:HD-GYP domain-containing protein (c-di-GMP phosphodiesterase class II)